MVIEGEMCVSEGEMCGERVRCVVSEGVMCGE